MKKQKAPFVPSTLKRLYSKLNLELVPLGLDVDRLDDYIQACANFYQIIEAEEVWKMKDRVLPKNSTVKNITRDLFDTFLSVASRDTEKGYRILPDKDFFDDGGEGLYIVNHPTRPDHPEFDERRRYEECVEKRYEDFYALQEQREGKPLYVPKDILKYLDEDYYERTPQVKAVEAFLRKVGVADIHSAMVAILADICDIGIPTQDLPEAVMAELEQYGGKVRGIQQYQQYLDLMMELSNNTRLPSNRGFTPNELRVQMSCMSGMSGMSGMPKKISFGPGIQQSIQDGELDAERMRSIIMKADLPDELKASVLSELDRAKNRQERKVGTTKIQ